MPLDKGSHNLEANAEADVSNEFASSGKDSRGVQGGNDDTRNVAMAVKNRSAGVPPTYVDVHREDPRWLSRDGRPHATRYDSWFDEHLAV